MVEETGIKEVGTFEASLHSRFFVELFTELIVQASFGSKILKDVLDGTLLIPAFTDIPAPVMNTILAFLLLCKTLSLSSAISNDPLEPPPM